MRCAPAVSQALQNERNADDDTENAKNVFLSKSERFSPWNISWQVYAVAVAQSLSASVAF